MYSYHFDDEAEFVALNPLGELLGGRSLSTGETRVDLPATTIPGCQFRVGQRCVISMDYPGVAGTYADPASGAVTLTARVTRRGLIRDVSVVEMRGMKPSSQEGIVREALANLRAWRLEPASHEGAVRITYAHVIDPSLAQPGQVDVQFDIPRQIMIRARSVP